MIGIIPAGGRGSRWGGMPKMLLPYHGTGKKWSLIDYTIDSMARAGADKFVIIASRDTIGPLTRHLEMVEKRDNIFYGINERGMWEAVKMALPLAWGNVCLFGMPDTYHQRNLFKGMVDLYKEDHLNFVLGTFETYTPERYGLLIREEGMPAHVLNKTQQGISVPRTAWGTLMWGVAVTNLWKREQPATYTEAINLALRYKWGTVEMTHYYDMASFSDYERLICER